MATPNSQLTDRKQSRPDIIITRSDFAQICSLPHFLLIKGTDKERPLFKLSPFAVNKVIVATLGSNPFSIKKIKEWRLLVEVEKETQSSKLMKTDKLSK